VPPPPPGPIGNPSFNPLAPSVGAMGRAGIGVGGATNQGGFAAPSVSPFDPQSTGTPGYAPPAGAGGGGTKPDLNSIDSTSFMQDLFGQRDKALSLTRGQQLAERKRILLGFGSKELAASILGASDPFVASISDDPNSDSFLGRANFALARNRLGADNTASVANTYYGGGRAFAYNDINRADLLARSDQEKLVKQGLQGLTNDYDTAAMDWEQRIIDARRQIALALMGQPV